MFPTIILRVKAECLYTCSPFYFLKFFSVSVFKPLSHSSSDFKTRSLKREYGISGGKKFTLKGKNLNGSKCAYIQLHFHSCMTLLCCTCSLDVLQQLYHVRLLPVFCVCVFILVNEALSSGIRQGGVSTASATIFWIRSFLLFLVDYLISIFIAVHLITN